LTEIGKMQILSAKIFSNSKFCILKTTKTSKFSMTFIYNQQISGFSTCDLPLSQPNSPECNSKQTRTPKRSYFKYNKFTWSICDKNSTTGHVYSKRKQWWKILSRGLCVPEEITMCWDNYFVSDQLIMCRNNLPCVRAPYCVLGQTTIDSR
jgi:hypothetical protein